MSKIINLTESDNGRTIKASQEDKVNVYLSTNPSTGFLWESKDISAGTLDKIQYDPVELPLILGKTTNIRFLFTVQQSGHFSLNYAQPWDKLTEPVRMFDIKIEVST